MTLGWPASLRVAWAARRRRRGLYDGATLAALACAHAKASSPAHLLAWALFRRDLGRHLPLRWVEPLRGGLASLPASRRRLALGILAEADERALADVPAPWLVDAGMRLPALAQWAGKAATRGLEEVHARQAEWRAGFAEWVEGCRQTAGVCVAGNAASTRGRGLGAAIDKHDCVIRFNQFARDAQARTDSGARLDVWVVSPGYSGPAPQDVRWVVMTGPDMRYRLQDWEPVLPLLDAGVPVLTVPLASWRTLVRDLLAPPSAGLLMLRWLADLGSPRGWEGLSSVGIGSGLGSQGRYHQASARLRAGSRHNWAAEQASVARWAAQGLTRLDTASAGAGE